MNIILEIFNSQILCKIKMQNNTLLCNYYKFKVKMIKIIIKIYNLMKLIIKKILINNNLNFNNNLKINGNSLNFNNKHNFNNL